jgi:hypothetical protein
MKAVLDNHTTSLIHDGNGEIDDMEETNDVSFEVFDVHNDASH